MTKVGDMLFTSPYGRPHVWLDKGIEITGETKFSWLMGDPAYKRDKVNKTTLEEAIPLMSRRQWFTAEGMAAEKFIRAYRHQIAHAVTGCKDVAKLKQIMVILEMGQ